MFSVPLVIKNLSTDSPFTECRLLNSSYHKIGIMSQMHQFYTFPPAISILVPNRDRSQSTLREHNDLLSSEPMERHTSNNLPDSFVLCPLSMPSTPYGSPEYRFSMPCHPPGTDDFPQNRANFTTWDIYSWCGRSDPTTASMNGLDTSS
jgi:hypothetical protein